MSPVSCASVTKRPAYNIWFPTSANSGVNNGVACSASGQYVFAGEYTTLNGSPVQGARSAYRSTNYGASFSVAYTTGATSYGIIGATCSRSGQYVLLLERTGAAPLGYRAIASNDYGATWGTPSAVISAAVSSSIVATNGGVFVFHGQGGTGYRSIDGNTWNSVTGPAYETQVVSVKNDETKMFAGCFGTVPYKSVDGGVTWTTIALPSASDTTGVIANSTGTTIIFLGVGKRWISTDSGANFSYSTISYNAPYKIAATPDLGLIVAGFTSSNVVAKSTDLGATWKVVKQTSGVYVAGAMPESGAFFLTAAEGVAAAPIEKIFI